MVTRPVASGVEIELRVVSARQSDEFNVVVDGRVAELGRWPSTLIAFVLHSSLIVAIVGSGEGRLGAA